jgi:hypothetical protein
MNNPSGTFYDGDHQTPWQVGPIKPWWDRVTRGQSYERKMRVVQAFWQASPIDEPGPSGGFLVEESKPEAVGGDIIEWTQTFMFTPPSRVVLESLVYPIQEIVTTNGQSDIAELPYETTAQVTYDYFHTNNAASVPVLHAYRAVKVANAIYFLGTKPTAGQLIIAQDSKVRQLAGSFYERKTARVTLASLTQNT